MIDVKSNDLLHVVPRLLSLLHDLHDRNFDFLLSSAQIVNPLLLREERRRVVRLRPDADLLGLHVRDHPLGRHHSLVAVIFGEGAEVGLQVCPVLDEDDVALFEV